MESKKVAWSDQDVARWREIYGVTEKEAAQAIKEAAQTPAQQFKVRINKFATDNIVSVAGIRLDEFAKNPLWHWQHNYRQPIGVSPKTYRENGKLKSVLELGIGIYEPDASMVQKGLASGQIRACSIGFMPLRWDFNKSRDGVDFHEIMLTEISACSLPACPGTILDGPVKSLQQQAADYRAQVAAYKAGLKRKFETRKAELAAEWRMRHGQ